MITKWLLDETELAKEKCYETIIVYEPLTPYISEIEYVYPIVKLKFKTHDMYGNEITRCNHIKLHPKSEVLKHIAKKIKFGKETPMYVIQNSTLKITEIEPEKGLYESDIYGSIDRKSIRILCDIYR